MITHLAMLELHPLQHNNTNLSINSLLTIKSNLNISNHLKFIVILTRIQITLVLIILPNTSNSILLKTLQARQPTSRHLKPTNDENHFS